jgi:membrane protease subunit HflK
VSGNSTSESKASPESDAAELKDALEGAFKGASAARIGKRGKKMKNSATDKNVASGKASGSINGSGGGSINGSEGGSMGNIVNLDTFGRHGRRNFDNFGKSSTPSGGGRKPDMKKIGLIVKLVVAAVIVLVAASSSFYNVDEQHNAVVTQLGRVVRTDTAGLHFKIPAIQKVRMVDMTTHGVGIGYSDGGGGYYGGYGDFGEGYGYASSDSVMITSDFNLLDIDFYLEYKVSDPVAYLYNTTRPEEMLNNMAYAAIRSTVVNYTVDEAMTTGKSQIQGEIKEKIQQWLTDEEVGMQVVNVQIQDAQPPTSAIQSAFKEVENAKQSKDTALNNARQYMNEQVPKAEAEADRIRQNAEATKASRIAEAEGQASRFNTMFEQYKANPLITRQRLFYEAMEEVLPGKKVIFSDGSTQQLLPIDSFSTITGGGANE